MGAEPYQYVVDYEPDIQAVLEKLRAQVFESGEFNGAEMNPATPEEAVEMTECDGTRSILDITTISETPDFCCAAPYTEDELVGYFGTARPTLETAQQIDDLWNDLERGQARYIVIYDGDKPTKILFMGYSFD